MAWSIRNHTKALDGAMYVLQWENIMHIDCVSMMWLFFIDGSVLKLNSHMTKFKEGNLRNSTYYT